MDFKYVTTLTLFTLFLGACNNGGGGSALTPIHPAQTPAPTNTTGTGTSTTTTTERLDYTFTEGNRCTTGTQKFTRKKDFCNALLDDALNNNCARNERSQLYTKLCSGETSTRVEKLPPYSAIRCVVNAMDLKDRSFLGKLNIFNPQRQQSFTDMPWNGRKAEEFGLMSLLGGQYGRARFITTPAKSEHGALGEVQLLQQKGTDYYSVRSGLGSQLRMLVTNHHSQKEVETVCVSDKSFRRSSAVRQLHCSISLGKTTDQRRNQELDLSWDGRSKLTKELLRTHTNETVILTLKPGVNFQESRMEIQANDLENEKTVVAESNFDEGLEVRYHGQQTKTELFVKCAPASK